MLIVTDPAMPMSPSATPAMASALKVCVVFPETSLIVALTVRPSAWTIAPPWTIASFVTSATLIATAAAMPTEPAWVAEASASAAASELADALTMTVPPASIVCPAAMDALVTFSETLMLMAAATVRLLSPSLSSVSEVGFSCVSLLSRAPLLPAAVSPEVR